LAILKTELFCKKKSCGGKKTFGLRGEKMANTKNGGILQGLTTILADKGSINPEEIDTVQKLFSEQELPYEEFLIAEGIVTKPELLDALAEYYELPALDVIGEFFDHHFLRLIPKGVLLRNAIIPLRREGDLLEVVVAQPDDAELLPLLWEYISDEVTLMVGFAPDIRETIEEFYDKSITYQPNQIENQELERSMGEVHPLGEDLNAYPNENMRTDKPEDRDSIPNIWEETNDDYESK